MTFSIQEVRQRVGKQAASFIQPDMIVGLGTGSTAAYFIQSLAERVRHENLSITPVATSQQSLTLAESLGLHCHAIDDVSHLDMTVDGADQIDTQNRMIKGGGGALLREKIVAFSTKEVVIIVDENKYVPFLGRHELPVEVASFGHLHTAKHLRKLGYQCNARLRKDNSLFYTDNGNVIYDLLLSNLVVQPEEENAKIKNIVGVVETGFFFQLAHRVLIGYQDGRIEVKV